MLRTSNPTLSEKIFQSINRTQSLSETMTVKGTINKSIILLLLVIASAAWMWGKVMNDPELSLNGWLIGGAIGGFVVAIVISFKKEWAPVLSPVYALLEGIFLGGISAIFNEMYPGIVTQAVALTLGVMFIMLFIYRSGLIKVTQKFRFIIMGATAAIALVYLIFFVMHLFGANVSIMYDSSPLGIGISLLVVGIAAFNFLLDFDLIEKGAESNLPKYMEWYAAFGLMVTLIWLYIEMLRLLAKIAGRKN